LAGRESLQQLDAGVRNAGRRNLRRKSSIGGHQDAIGGDRGSDVDAVVDRMAQGERDGKCVGDK
jgi:hypothetical protein